MDTLVVRRHNPHRQMRGRMMSEDGGETEGAAGDDDLGETSLHVRRALTGDAASLEWLVTRLSPLLVLEARERLGPDLGRLYDADDLVQDAWLITLPRL